MFFVKEVRSQDAEFLWTLMNQKELLAALREAPTSLEDWRFAAAEWSKDADEQNYILWDGTVPIGWVGVNGLCSKDKYPWLKIAALLPEYQGKGHGQAAIMELAAMLKNQGFFGLRLYTDQDNIKAQRCYHKCGFTVIKETGQKMANGETVKRYLMEKTF